MIGQENMNIIYMVYVNPYVGPHYESGGWITKLEEGYYTWDSNLRRAALHHGTYSNLGDAKKALNWAEENDMIIFSKIMDFTQEEIYDLTEGEKNVKRLI